MIDTGSSELNTKWKNVLHNSADDYIIPESNVCVVCPYDCVDMSGSAYSVVAYSYSSYCDLTQLKNSPAHTNRNKKIATWEWNYWVLDGSFDVLDTDEKFNGYMSSAYSSENCSLSANFWIENTGGGTFKFNKKQTIKFNPMASECPAKVTLRSQITPSGSGTIVNNEVEFDIASMLEDDDLQNQEYIHLYSDDIDDTLDNDLVFLSFLNTLMPFRRIRISEYNNGYKFYKDKHDLLTFTHTKSVSLCMDELPQNDLQISFTDLEGLFDSQRSDSPFKIVFNSSHRFYIYYGYNFDDIGWNYVQVDFLALNNFEINRDSIETILNLQSTLQLFNQYYTTSMIQADDPASFKGFINKIGIRTGTSFIYDSDIRNLEYGRQAWGNFLVLSGTADGEFAKTPMKEVLQQLVALIRCALVRKPDGNFRVHNLYSHLVEVVDSIEAHSILAYPTKTEGEHYKYVTINTPKIDADQNDDTDVSKGTMVLLKTRNRYTISQETLNISDEADIQEKVIPLGDYYNQQAWTWSNDLWEYFANHYWLVKKSTRYEFGELMLNPLIEVADVVRLFLGENYNQFLGRVEKIEINYDGSFKGAVTICSIDD